MVLSKATFCIFAAGPTRTLLRLLLVRPDGVSRSHNTASEDSGAQAAAVAQADLDSLDG
jgi:hypothetical protein